MAGAFLTKLAGTERGREMPRPLTDAELSRAQLDELRAAYRVLRLRIDHIIAGLADRRLQGLFTGGLPPYGFSVDYDNERLVEVTEEQSAGRRARELRQRGLSLRAVAQQLEEEGMLSRNGKRFAPTQVNRILHNRQPR